MWLFFALGASMFWGITYTLNEQVYRHISFLTSLAISMTIGGIVAGVLAFSYGLLGKDFSTMSTSPRLIFFVLAQTLGLILAEACIGYSITEKDAALSSLIEISYPLFIVIFSYLMFRESNITLPVAIGGALIFLGVGTIYMFSR